MKKSFKKAGAAVLSMAMLLSMGAMSMPVYAETPSAGTFGQIEPGQVTVHITGLDTNAYHQGEGSADYDSVNGEGPDTDAKTAWEAVDGNGTYTEKYDYLNLGPGNNLDALKNIEEAEVTMYQVATLTPRNGWDWVQYIKDNAGTIPGFTTFENLLKNKDGGTGAVSDVTGKQEFITSSEDLQKMASHLERVIDGLEKNVASAQATYDAAYAADPASQATTNALAALNTVKANRDALLVGSGKIDQSNKATGLTIPNIKPAYLDAQGNNDGVLDQNEYTLTTNTIGYYLIVTKTDQAGTIVQPVLVSLHNGEHKNVSVKGSTIQFEKTMTQIYSTDEGDVKGADRFASSEGSNLKNGLVAKDDVISYEIKSQLPQYDPNVKQSNITDFIIHDTASTGITIDAPTVTGATAGTEAATIVDPEKFEVYLANDPNDFGDESKTWKLTGSTSKNVGDYELVLDEDGHGFDLIISGYQMVQEDTRKMHSNGTTVINNADPTDGKVDSVGMIEGINDASYAIQTLNYATSLDNGEDGANQSGARNMYNMYILVKFKATVNKDENGNAVTDEDNLAFRRKFDKYITESEVTREMLNAVGETDLESGDAGYADAKKDDALTQAIRVQLFNGETRYNKTYSASDYASDADAFVDMDDSVVSNIKDALNATGWFTEAVADDWNVATDDQSKLCRILVLLAKDKYNIELNGEYNTAHLTYGNRYAVGDGDVKMTTNYSKVYSVGLKLDKFIETLQLEGVTTIPNTIVAYSNFWDTNANKEVEITYEDASDSEQTVTVTLATVETEIDDEYKLAGLNALTGTYPSALDDEGATEAQTNKFDPDSDDEIKLSDKQKKLMAYLIAQHNEDATADGKYQISDENSKKPVEGAIFHLTRIAENNTSGDADVVKDYGYAVSNKAGNLIKLELVGTTTGYDTQADADAVTVTDGKKKFVFKDGNKWYVGVADISGDTVTGDNTWDMLDIGYYEISEVSVPVGFKKWDKARFQIKADKDTAGKDLFTNSWTGSYSAEGLGIDTAEVSTSHGLASIDETAAGAVNFLYYENKATGKYNDQTDKAYSDGYLYHELYNEYLDELPATGGMGTVLFTAGGIAVILMAGALFVVYMKKRNAEEEE